MGEKPILFSGQMVRAVLNGSKTQTRRTVKGSPVEMIRLVGADDKPTGEFGICSTHARVMDKRVKCPYGLVGDLLWVRETIKQRPMANFLTGEPTKAIVAAYAADDEDVVESAGFNLGPWWKGNGSLPAIHMPRWASRITFEITDVRVQRLQDISEEDAKAEGALWEDCWPTYRQSFEALWESINGPGSWEANPWIWAITFRKIERASSNLAA